jgi:hypothetical protein
MKESKSKLLQAARRVRAEIYKTVEAELLDDSGANPRTYREVAEANFISVATVQRIAGSLGISRQVGPHPMGRSERLAEVHAAVQQRWEDEEQSVLTDPAHNTEERVNHE